MLVFVSRLRTAGGSVSYAFACAQSHACPSSVTRHIGSSEPVNASPFPHMNEPVKAAASLSNERDAFTASFHVSELSNERDAATSLHMTEPVHAATFSCPPYTSRIPPHHSSKPFTPSSSFQTFHTLLIIPKLVPPHHHSKPFIPSSYESFRSSSSYPPTNARTKPTGICLAPTSHTLRQSLPLRLPALSAVRMVHAFHIVADLDIY